MLAGSKLTLRFGDFSSSSVRRSRSAVSWPVSKARVTPLAAASSPAWASVSSIADRAGSPGSGRKPGVERQVGEAQRDRAVECPLQPLDPLGPERGVAEAAGRLDRLRRRVVFAGEAEHRAGHDDARGMGGRGHRLAFVPARVVRVAAGDLHDVDAQLVEEALQLGDALDLEAPATDAQGERRQTGMNRREKRLRHVRLLGSAWMKVVAPQDPSRLDHSGRNGAASSQPASGTADSDHARHLLVSRSVHTRPAGDRSTRRVPARRPLQSRKRR